MPAGRGLRPFAKALLVACLLAATGFGWWLWRPSIRTGNEFTPHPMNAVYNLFDVGVVDVNGDGILDVFTSNHFSQQRLLIGDGRGRFTDRMSEMRFDQAPEVPGLEDADSEPSGKQPGLHIYWQRGELILQGRQNHRDSRFSGEIGLSSPLVVKKKHLTDVKVEERPASPGATRTRVEFTMEADGRMVLLPALVGLPVSFRLGDGIPPDRVYIGAREVQARARDFVLALRDRHGMAWADYNGDGRIDVFIARGGLKGRMKQISETFSDELLSNTGAYFEDRTDQSGIVKGNCPARQVAWVDFDGDGLLDLYIVCGREGSDGESYPNLLFRQERGGRFVDVAKEAGLDLPDLGSFVWLDADNDGDMDMLWASDKGFWLYVNQSGKFEAKFLGPNPGGVATKLTISDYDLDGDLDVFAASPEGNTLLINRGGAFVPTDPASVGLPKTGVCANWVDYDNDGLPDLHLFPGGLYRQRTDHMFAGTGLLGHRSGARGVDARCNWFDADNDGARDLLMAVQWQPSKLSNRLQAMFLRVLRLFGIEREWTRPDHWELTLYRNEGAKNHWLEMDLAGPTGNPQAIGARVTVVTPADAQLQQAGWAEGSRYSQGHYRFYFGLGSHEKAALVRIVWPDGRLQEMRDVAGDRLLRVRYPAGGDH